ncbi:MAG: helicase C-terminal domain-containing protein [Candidatus Pacearchaeota archaeon]
MTWSLFEEEKELAPLVYSNGKTQLNVIEEVIEEIKKGCRIIFIKGICGTGKSAIALNLAREFGKTSIVVPIKSLQEQYIKDYTHKKYVFKKNKFRVDDFPEFVNYPNLKKELEKNEKLKISSIIGRKNFKCRFLEENKELRRVISLKKERNISLFKNSEEEENNLKNNTDFSCDNDYIPCKIEIKEKNIEIIKNYIKENLDKEIYEFEDIKDIKRILIAPLCPYWSPILPAEYSNNNLKDSKKISYNGLSNKKFVINRRKPGCGYYDQYISYAESDVIIFNSLKYKIESLMNRKPLTEIEIIDECDEFLDSFTVEENISLNKLFFALNSVHEEDIKIKKFIKLLNDITNNIKISKRYGENSDIFPIKNTDIEYLLKTVLENSDLMDIIETDESSYLCHLDEVARSFSKFFDETFFSIEKKENDFIISLVTTNLEKKFKELLNKNKILILMSGTIHSEFVIRNIFGITDFKIIYAETKTQGKIIKNKTNLEMDCSYESFQKNLITREKYLTALSKIVDISKKPVLVNVTAFNDLPTDKEKKMYNLNNLPTQDELIEIQKNDSLGERIFDFKNKKLDILFTTKCNRGIDFPGDMCNSIVITKFPYPNVNGIFWKILKKTRPLIFMPFYIDKANRELLQRVYRGLRSKDDKIELFSPDVRVLEFNFV